MKYKIPLIWLLIYFIVMAFTPLINTGLSFSKIIPGSYNGLNIFFILLFSIILSLIFGIFFGYIFAPLYLIIHKFFMGYKKEYLIQEIPKPEKFKRTFIGLFPALLTVNIAIILTPNLINEILTEDAFIRLQYGAYVFYTFVSIIPYLIGPSLGLFAGTWFLNEAGIGYSNKKKAREKGAFVETKSVGSWFQYYLKGYAGIAVIFSYIYLLQVYLPNIYAKDLWYVLILTFSLPIVLAISTIPTIIILDLLKEHRIKYILAIARKLGITKILKVE